MAGDTRDTNSPPQTRGATSVGTAPPPHVGTPSRYEVFQGPPESANALPEGSGQNTAGSTPPVPKLSDAIKTLRIEDIKQVHMYPCVRESLLYGIGGGFGVGGVRALWGAPIPKAANWAVGTFVFLSFATHEFCQYRRFLEKSHMKRAVEIIDRKKANKEAEAQRKREERRRLKDDADKAAEEASKKSSWKFW